MAGTDWAIGGVVSGSGPFLGGAFAASTHQLATRYMRACIEYRYCQGTAGRPDHCSLIQVAAVRVLQRPKWLAGSPAGP